MELIFKKAGLDDLETLVRIRIEVLRDANRLSADADMSAVESESAMFCREALRDGTTVAYLVYDSGRFAGTGAVCFYRVMPTYHNPTGKKAYIMNMYTVPGCRRRGIAFQVLDRLVREAKARGVSHITLEATEEGRPLYEKYGFIGMTDEMILPE